MATGRVSSNTVLHFLENVISDLPDEPGLSLKPNCYCMSGAEMEGEVIETVLRYLKKRKCSDVIASVFAQAVYQELRSGSITGYELEHDLDQTEDTLIQYEASKVAKGILSIMNKMRTKWKEKEPDLIKNAISYQTSCHSIKNRRRTMEDKHSIVSQYNIAYKLDKETEECALFSVFDGHGGVDAACYASSQLAIHLRSMMKSEKDLNEALRKAYLLTDQSYIEKAKQERLRSGCTGVTVLLTKAKMYVAWIGDSQVVLCKGKSAHELMTPHKPDREDERKRIEALGGCVVWFGGWRVNGSLAVSRAIGDYEQKPYVSGDPDISDYTFTGDEKFVILGCDGLFDVITPENAVQLTLAYLEQGNDPETAAEMLVSEAKRHESMDNITVLVVFLDDHVSKLHEGYLTTTEFETPKKSNADLSEYDVVEVLDVDKSRQLNGEANKSSETEVHSSELSDSFTELSVTGVTVSKVESQEMNLQTIVSNDTDVTSSVLVGVERDK